MSGRGNNFFSSLITHHLLPIKMEPQISHRCKSCGASIRAGTQYCHQCGEALAATNKADVVAPDVSNESVIKKTERSLPALPLALNVTLPGLPFADKQSAADQRPQSSGERPRVIALGAVTQPNVLLQKGRRAKNTARDLVADNVMPKLEKLRHVSSYVLEEASAIDPSIRFVLITLILFVIFVVLFLLSFIK
jgi:hypothetical protein